LKSWFAFRAGAGLAGMIRRWYEARQRRKLLRDAEQIMINRILGRE